jgi:anti-sigma factor RsiW
MNVPRKREEELIELVFGDLPSERADRLRQAIDQDPELRRAYECYLEMREDLASMRDVPEDQLSLERLRHAILARGLEEQKNRRLFPGWLWMPASSMALAAVLISARGWMPGPEPKYVTDATLDTSGPAVALDLPASLRKAVVREVASNETAPQARPQPKVRRNSERRNARAENGPVLVAMSTPAESKTVLEEKEEEKAQPVVTEKTSATMVADAPSAEPPAVVLIQEEGSEGMGAMRAVEMESFQHVVVGG